MRPVNIKKLNYKDQVARRHRRTFVFRVVLGGLGIGAAGAGLVYLLFFSRFFEVREISFSGLDVMSSDELRSKINDTLNQKLLRYITRRSNIFFVSASGLEKEFTSTYPIFKSVKVAKKLFHGLIFNFVERKPAGVWCFKESCSYFDNDKILWGHPAKSSGFIFLTIEDKRDRPSREIDDEFFKPIMEVARESGTIKNVVISADSFHEFRVYTAAGYYIMFSLDSNIKNQLEIFNIFLAERDKSLEFHPQYVDLRIDGRIYYK